MKVAYGNGESEEIVYKAEVRKDELTRWLDLNSDQFIKEIQLAYDPRPNFKGTAYVEVYDQYAESWVGPQGEGKGYNQGCVLLGSQMAGFTIDRPTTVLPIADVTLILETDLGVRRLQQFDCLVQTAAWQADMT